MSDISKFGKPIKGQLFKFGHYPQSGETPEPIEWEVLDIKDGKALLFSHKVLDIHIFDSKSNNYANSELRAWLNNDFFNAAFNSEEREYVALSEIDNGQESTKPFGEFDKWNSGNPHGQSNFYICDNTYDRVFLLSEHEVTNPDYGYSANVSFKDTTRAKEPTHYATSRGLHQYGGHSFYYLRTPGPVMENKASEVNDEGCCFSHDTVSYFGPGVCPAIWYIFEKEDNFSTTFKNTDQEVVKGGKVIFGSYIQDKTEKEPILWDVLDVKDGKALLLADRIIETYRFDKNTSNYKDSEVRSWLNDYFLNNAFTKEEQEIIFETEVDNSVRQANEFKNEKSFNLGNNEHCCENTTDKLFLLSQFEITNPNYGFAQKSDEQDKQRFKKVTEYAKAKGAYCDSDGYGWYFLRTPYFSDCKFAQDVYDRGCSNYAASVIGTDGGILPALWVEADRLKSLGKLPLDVELKQEFKKGNVVKFGSYPQETGFDEPILWDVLDVKDNKALLLSRRILDSRRYDDNSNNYERSELRSWLNHDFLNRAFSLDEQKRIVLTSIDNSERSTNEYQKATTFNNGKNSYACKNTLDKVFLVSMKEITNPEYGFNPSAFENDSKRARSVTPYAKKHGAYSDVNGWFYLRSPRCNDINSVWGVNSLGSCKYCDYIDHVDDGILPAIWVDFKPEEVKDSTLKDVKVHQVVEFGSYPYSSEMDIQPIKWDVLEVKDGKALLFARDIIDTHRFDEDSEFYNQSEIANWLNNEFYNRAFNQNEKANILVEVLENHVFLPSIYDMTNPLYGFKKSIYNHDASRTKKVTGYALSKGARTSEGGYGWYYLRDHKFGTSKVVYNAKHDGSLNAYGFINHNEHGVAPAIWVKVEGLNSQTTTRNFIKNITSDTDYISFGSYPQSSSTPEPIKWEVLKIEDGKALLISDKILDAHKFDDESNDFAESDIRTWLNNDFFNKAFNEQEKACIVYSKVDNSDKSRSLAMHPDTDLESNGHFFVDTYDYVFLPSLEELTTPSLNYFNDFTSSTVREKHVTEYAKSNGLKSDQDNFGWYFTRSAGLSYWQACDNQVWAVRNDGSITRFGYINNEGCGVVPVIWVYIQ